MVKQKINAVYFPSLTYARVHNKTMGLLEQPSTENLVGIASRLAAFTLFQVRDLDKVLDG